MHIPDGFLSPSTYLPATAVSAGAWVYGSKRVGSRLDQRTLPWMGVLTALAFVLMMLTLPLPGGTSVHFTGVALLAVLFGVWPAFLSLSMVLLLQAVLVGAGGITSLPVNALALGLVGAAAARGGWKVLRPWREEAGLFVGAWLSVVLPAVLLALILGAQPHLAHDPDGTPRFFPFGWEVTLPAVVLPHLLLGIGEGLLTVAVVRLLRRVDPALSPAAKPLPETRPR